MSEGLRSVTLSGFCPVVRVTACCRAWRIPSQLQLLLEQPSRVRNVVLPPHSAFLPHLSVCEYVTLNAIITVTNV